MKWIAHRSGPANFPEQTILSARDALSAGADAVEIDVRFTKDARLAVSHDQNLNRIFGTDRNIGDMTAAEFLSLRHTSDPGCPAHLFEDYLKCGIVPLLIHIKENRVIAPLLETVAAYGASQHVILGVSDLDSVTQIHSFDPQIKILSFAPSPDDTAGFIAAGVDYIRLWEGWLTPERVQLVRDSRCGLWIMSGGTDGREVGEPTAEQLKAILAYRPDGILINNIPFAHRVYSEYQATV